MWAMFPASRGPTVRLGTLDELNRNLREVIEMLLEEGGTQTVTVR